MEQERRHLIEFHDQGFKDILGVFVENIYFTRLMKSQNTFLSPRKSAAVLE